MGIQSRKTTARRNNVTVNINIEEKPRPVKVIKQPKPVVKVVKQPKPVVVKQRAPPPPDKTPDKTPEFWSFLSGIPGTPELRSVKIKNFPEFLVILQEFPKSRNSGKKS